MDLSWLQVCAEGQAEGCIPTIQLVYLAALVVGVVLLAIIAVRSRDLSTATLALMPVAIAINIAVGAIAVALRLPIYLDSIGTVLVGAVAGPWAGALTGLLANLIWAILPVPGGAGPTIAFFAPVAAVIGLMAGFWAGRGAFRLRADDERVGRLPGPCRRGGRRGARDAGRPADGRPLLRLGGPRLADALRAPGPRSSSRSASCVAWVSGRTVFRLACRRRTDRPLPLDRDGHLGRSCIVFAVLRLLFAPEGYFSTIDGRAGRRDRRTTSWAGRTSRPSRSPTRPVSWALPWSPSWWASSSGAGSPRASGLVSSRSGWAA